MRLPWWGVLCVILAGFALSLLFNYFGKASLALPSLDSAGVIGVAVASRWQLRRHVWFWTTMAVIVALHVPLIVFTPWTTKWVPAVLIIPIAVLDLYLMLKIVSMVEKFMEGPKTAER